MQETVSNSGNTSGENTEKADLIGPGSVIPILNLSNVYVKIFYRVVEVTTTLTTDFHF